MFPPVTAVVAERKLLPSVVPSLNDVDVSTDPVAETRATVRGTVEPVMLDTPVAASYPVAIRDWSSADSVSSPSLRADPDSTRECVEPLSAVGSATEKPLGVPVVL